MAAAREARKWGFAASADRSVESKPSSLKK
jgi:hypothetical protein